MKNKKRERERERNATFTTFFAKVKLTNYY